MLAPGFTESIVKFNIYILICVRGFLRERGERETPSVKHETYGKVE